jgi:hypothetical protein
LGAGFLILRNQAFFVFPNLYIMTFLKPNRYYKLSPWLAWPLSVLALLLSGFIITEILDLVSEVSALYYLLLFPLLPFLMFLSTPFMRVAGIYKYYSPLFLTFGETGKRFEIHSGPSIDYLLHLRGIKPGQKMQRTVLAFYLQGILSIAAKIEQGEVPPEEVEVVGTSYFFSDRSVERMGFEVGAAGWLHRINLIANVVELTFLHSLSAGKLEIPNVLRVKRANMTGKRLLEHREYIERLYQRMATERNREQLISHE